MVTFSSRLAEHLKRLQWPPAPLNPVLFPACQVAATTFRRDVARATWRAQSKLNISGYPRMSSRLKPSPPLTWTVSKVSFPARDFLGLHCFVLYKCSTLKIVMNGLLHQRVFWDTKSYTQKFQQVWWSLGWFVPRIPLHLTARAFYAPVKWTFPRIQLYIRTSPLIITLG